MTSGYMQRMGDVRDSSGSEVHLSKRAKVEGDASEGEDAGGNSRQVSLDQMQMAVASRRTYNSAN